LWALNNHEKKIKNQHQLEEKIKDKTAVEDVDASLIAKETSE